jgi:hypothetical protein
MDAGNSNDKTNTQEWIKISPAISHVSWLKSTDVSGTIYVSVIRV